MVRRPVGGDPFQAPPPGQLTPNRAPSRTAHRDRLARALASPGVHTYQARRALAVHDRPSGSAANRPSGRPASGPSGRRRSRSASVRAALRDTGFLPATPRSEDANRRDTGRAAALLLSLLEHLDGHPLPTHLYQRRTPE